MTKTALAFEGEPENPGIPLFDVPFDPWALKRQFGRFVSDVIQKLIDMELKVGQEIDKVTKTIAENDCRD